ncbi:hypothetical protein GCM10018793_65290 [Streptomyces sulfonofaciens]|uniref:Phosphatidic acid phosphatase type 2/haloperoxidase domain-containing protein n=1 Tax=Streptomyces sulfonofaciens TaxID=68272 RepID=A0A919GN32_9ACTN|nr:hypothetical protein GCM10018793_65290 [Streptomyces sulfonofaciens]
MAGLATSGSNPDVSLLYEINGLAKDSPGWADRTLEFLGEYGLLLGLVLLVLACWWSQRRHAPSLDAAASSVAAVVWTPLAAGIAVLVNVPIRGFVGRPRPFVDHEGIDVLIHGKNDYSFVSDHATLAMAMAVGLFVASRKFGIAGLVLALAEGFCRVFMGVHYPTDVIGGFALGTAVVLLLSPLASAALTPLMKAIGRSAHAGWLVRSRASATDAASAGPGGADSSSHVHARVLADADAGEDEEGAAADPAPWPGRPAVTARSDAAGAEPEAELLAGRQGERPARVQQSRTAPQDRGRAVARDAERSPRRDPEAALRTGAERTRRSDTDTTRRPGPDADEEAAMSGAPQDPSESGPRDPQGPREPDLAA